MALFFRQGCIESVSDSIFDSFFRLNYESVTKLSKFWDTCKYMREKIVGVKPEKCEPTLNSSTNESIKKVNRTEADCDGVGKKCYLCEII